MQTLVARGLVDAAEGLGGDDMAAVCATLDQWRDHGERELPWLAGPLFFALGRVSVTPPTGPAVRILERFLIGAHSDADEVRQAIDRCIADAGEPGPPLPPDVQGAMVDSVERFLELLARAYQELHEPIRSGHHRDAGRLVELWQQQLDDAAVDVHHRAEALLGLHQTSSPRPGRASSDRAMLAIGFVAVAVLTAAVVLWLVARGWPVIPVDLPI